MTKMSKFLVLAGVLFVSACSSLSPGTITDAFVARAQFPTLSMAVSSCIGDHPVREEIRPAWERLVDKWEEASDLEPNADILVKIAYAPGKIAQAEHDWNLVKTKIVQAGLDCGPGVKASVENIEKTFDEIRDAVKNNQRAVSVLEWANLLRAVVVGGSGKVVRI